MAKRVGVDFSTVRQLFHSLPGVVEGTSYGTPGFRLRGRLLARLQEDDETLVLSSDDRELLIDSDPATFFVTPHYQDYPRVLVRLKKVKREMLRELIEKAWRAVASARQIKELESGAFKAPQLKDLPQETPRRLVTKDESARHLERTRSACRSLPEVEEKLAWGAPTFRAGGKMFAMFVSNHHGDGRIALWLNVAPGVQQMLVNAAPEKFFVPPYTGKQGWVGLHLDRSDDVEVAFHLSQAYRRVAHPRLVTVLDARRLKPGVSE